MNGFVSILRRQCSHCRQGNIFQGLWRMNETCPECGIRFEREQGYWMVSVFLGYVLYGVVLIPLTLALYFQQVPANISFPLVGVIVVLMALPVFIYARVIWLYLDELLDPREDVETVTPEGFLDAGVDIPDSNK